MNTAPRHDGSYHAEFKDGTYRWIASDRGAYLDLMETTRAEQFLEWIALDLTRALAHQDVYVKSGNDRPSDELRRESNRRQVELVRLLDPDWAARKESQLKRDDLL